MNRLSAFCLWLLLWLALPTAWAGHSVSTLSGNLLLTPAHGGDGSAWGKADCRSCHTLSGIHATAPAKTREMTRIKGYATCAGCHGGNGASAPRACGVCHNRHDLPESPLLSGRHRHDFSVDNTRRLGDGKCLVCHVKPDMDGEFEPNVDLTALPDQAGEFTPIASNTDFCLRCHNRDHPPAGLKLRPRPQYGLNDPLISIEENYRQIDRHGYVDGEQGPYYGLRDERSYRYGQWVECTDCHVMHGTRNRKLLLDDSRKGVFELDPLLRLRPYKAIVKQGNSAQLCVLCHEMKHPEVEQGTRDTGNGLSGVHDVSSNCADCHTHGEPLKGGL